MMNHHEPCSTLPRHWCPPGICSSQLSGHPATRWPGRYRPRDSSGTSKCLSSWVQQVGSSGDSADFHVIGSLIGNCLRTTSPENHRFSPLTGGRAPDLSLGHPILVGGSLPPFWRPLRAPVTERVTKALISAVCSKISSVGIPWKLPSFCCNDNMRLLEAATNPRAVDVQYG